MTHLETVNTGSSCTLYWGHDLVLYSYRHQITETLYHSYCELRTVQLSPLVALQLRLIQQLSDRDPNMIFAEPVDMEEVSCNNSA